MSNQKHVEVSPNVRKSAKFRGGDRCVEVSPDVRKSAKLRAIQASEGNSNRKLKEKQKRNPQPHGRGILWGDEVKSFRSFRCLEFPI